MIFDIKIGENFRRKARMLVVGRTTKTPGSFTYSSVFSIYLVRIMLIVASLNGLDLKALYIDNVQLTDPCRKNIWKRSGPKFGINEGKLCIVVRALYRLKSSDAAFRAFLVEILDEIGSKYIVADPDVWYREAMKSYCEGYYEYILDYVDDLLAI